MGDKVSVEWPNAAAVLHEPRVVRVERRPLPEVGPREVLVEVRTVGVCGSDVHYYEHGRIGSYVVTEPLVLGHEVSGVVVARGSEAMRHPLGERVALEPGVPCGRCTACRTGRYNLCADMRFFATPPIDGALARYVAIHEDYAFAIPGSLSYTAGALLEPLSCAISACRKGQVGLGSRVLVTGAGPIGNLAAQVAHAAGAAAVVVADINQPRLDRVAAVGATSTVNTAERGFLPGDGPFDVLLECTGNEALTGEAIAQLEAGGCAVLVGMGPNVDASLPLALIQQREIVVTGIFRYTNTYPAAIALAAAGRIDLDGLVDERFTLAATDAALRANRETPHLLKVVVDVSTDEGHTPPSGDRAQAVAGDGSASAAGRQASRLLRLGDDPDGA